MRRWEIIQLLINKYNLKSYVEIGVHNRECYDKIQCEVKQCVDPNFPATWQMTSDEYFKQHASFNDIYFIDGLHTLDQTYKDLVNASHYLNRGGFIVVHDCSPLTEWHTRPAEEYKRGQEWNGTTFLGYIKFKEERFDLDCYVVDTDYGCGVITERVKPEKRVVTWGYFDENRERILNLVSVDTFKHNLEQ